jgi:hypothetical protein
MVLLLSGPAPAQEAVRLPCAPSDSACALKAARDHAVRRIDTWKADLARPLDKRIGAAPPALVDYLTLANMLQGFPQRPRSELPDPAFMEDVKAAIAELPPQVWRLFEQRLVGVYFVANLGGTGYTDLVKDGDGKPVAAYTVLDSAVLHPLTANSWATWKERSPFKPRDGYSLEARIEDGAGDNRKNAIQYILLHELAHVLSVGRDFHPSWDIDPRDVPDLAPYRFFDLSWTVDRRDNRYAAMAERYFRQRRDVRYYLGYRLDASDMEPVYDNLEKSNFPSLYAVTSPGDDFAEAFASYVHVVLLKRPWQITLSRDGKVVKTIKACWEERRCAAKRKLLEEIVR